LGPWQKTKRAYSGDREVNKEMGPRQKTRGANPGDRRPNKEEELI